MIGNPYPGREITDEVQSFAKTVVKAVPLKFGCFEWFLVLEVLGPIVQIIKKLTL